MYLPLRVSVFMKLAPRGGTMNRFKMAFAVLAVLVILAAPAYAQSTSRGCHAAVPSLSASSRPAASVDLLQTAAKFSETLYAERQP